MNTTGASHARRTWARKRAEIEARARYPLHNWLDTEAAPFKGGQGHHAPREDGNLLFAIGVGVALCGVAVLVFLGLLS